MGQYRRWWSLIGLVVGMVMLFPPQRRIADWYDPATGSFMPADFEPSFDHVEFGYIPAYAWIGRLGQYQYATADLVTVTLDGVGPYQYSGFRWGLDWLYMIGQTAVLLIVLLLIFRADMRHRRPFGRCV